MHLVFLNQYYPPDAAPTGVMLQAVAEECTRQGHQVTVICAAGGYAEGGRVVSGRLSVVGSCSGVSATVGDCSSTLPNQKSEIHNHQSSIGDQGSGMGDHDQAVAQSSPPIQHSTSNIQHSLPTIHRLPATRFGRGTFVGKLLDYASYYVGVAWRLGTMNPPPDRIVALTTPPYLSVLARAVSKWRGADHAHWVMDLYPDVMVAHGMLAEGGWKHRLLAGLARWGFGGQRCAAVLTLGPDMAERSGGVIRTQSPESRVQTEVEIQNLKFKIQNCSPLISWVPLWGAGKSRNAECGTRNEVGGDQRAGDHDAAGRREHGLGPDAAAAGLRVARGWGVDELVVMYSGNMGLGHRFGEILEIAREKTSERPSESRQGRVSDASGAGGANENSPSVTSFPSPAPDLLEKGPCPGNLQTASERISENRQGRVSDASGAGGANENSPSVTAFPSPAPDLLEKGPCLGNLQTASNSQLSTLIPQPLQKPRFVFYGGGKRRREIEAFMVAHPEAPVELHDYAPAEDLSAHLMTADVHLVSLEPAWSGTMVPSKLQGIFAVGRPVVFVGSRESSIGRWVEQSGGGWVVAAGDVEGLRAAMEEARDPQVRQARGEAAATFARECFDRETNVKRVVEVLAGER